MQPAGKNYSGTKRSGKEGSFTAGIPVFHLIILYVKVMISIAPAVSTSVFSKLSGLTCTAVLLLLGDRHLRSNTIPDFLNLAACFWKESGWTKRGITRNSLFLSQKGFFLFIPDSYPLHSGRSCNSVLRLLHSGRPQLWCRI